MRKNPVPLIAFVAAIVIAAVSFIGQKDRNKVSDPVEIEVGVEATKPTSPIDLKSDTKAELSKAPVSSTTATAIPPANIISLTAGNFQSFVLRCFQGERCELSEDPMKLYEEFKVSGNRRANDNLISFMRKQLTDPKFRDQYKDSLLQMIQDFYPREEKQFQEAAYYNYLGDLQKSLDLYLDLEKQSSSDPSLRSAPNLNIANTYYDLGKFQEALPYYQTALGEYLSRQEQVIIPSTNEMVRFIEGRIGEIKSKGRL